MRRLSSKELSLAELLPNAFDSILKPFMLEPVDFPGSACGRASGKSFEPNPQAGDLASGLLWELHLCFQGENSLILMPMGGKFMTPKMSMLVL